MAADVDVWAARQARLSAAKMALSISATGLVKHRPGFGQTVRPAKGSVLAAPGPGDPDYFFHWLRDSAAVMEAVRLLAGSGDDAEEWRRHFADFVRFSLGLRDIDGTEFLRGRDIRRDVAPDMLQYVRPDAEIAAVAGGAVHGDVRYSADGMLDFIRWSRPQHDGPALRALVCLRFREQGIAGEALRDVDELIRLDLDYTLRHAGEPCYDIWEEEIAWHYYTVLVQFAALERGAQWFDAGGGDGAALRAKAGELRGMLDGFWSDAQGIYRSRILPQGAEHPRDPDFAVILGVLHAGRASGAHSVADERVLATMTRLEALFARAYAINRGRGAGLAFGRYEGDRYISGGAFYFSTWGAAEFYYRLAAAKPASAAEFLAKGDAIFATAREFVPETGDMSEQFDQTTGAQTSALNLAWSHAAFLTAWQARRAAQIAAGRAS